jgi:hypothetical protein
MRGWRSHDSPKIRRQRRPDHHGSIPRSGSRQEGKNKHQKAEDAAKELITRELKQHRQVDVQALADKEIVVVQVDGVDTVKIECKSSERFDQKGFAMLHPDQAKEFTKPSAATYYDSLL